MFTVSVVGEEKALAPKGKAGGEMLKRGGDWQSVEDLAIIIWCGVFPLGSPAFCRQTDQNVFGRT